MNNHKDVVIEKPVWEQVAEQIGARRDRLINLILIPLAMFALCFWWPQYIGSVMMISVAGGIVAALLRPCKPTSVVSTQWIASQPDAIKAWLAGLVPANEDGLLRYSDIDNATRKQYFERIDSNVRDNRAMAVAKQRAAFDDRHPES